MFIYSKKCLNGAKVMLSFYTVLSVLCWMALGVLCVLVHENSWIPKKDKSLFYLTYAVLAASLFAEWLGIQLSGNPDIPTWLLSLVKCLDYILTPVAGGAVVAQMKLRNNCYKALIAVLAFNTVFQIIAAFNQWMIVIDENNNYMHGSMYGFYIGIYTVVIALTAAEFLLFSLSYRKRNRASMISVFLLVITGVLLQEILGSEYRTAYVALTMGVTLMYIHYTEFYKMAADEHIQNQRKQLMKDVLCGVFSRYAYEKDIEKYSKAKQLSPNFTVFVFDINGLKAVNDTMGHDAGDKLIIGAAKCIEKVIGNAGRCYRTGGDEFVVFTIMERKRVEDIPARLKRETARWSENNRDLVLTIAAGYARAEDFRDYTVEELVKKADKAMYASKSEYYLATAD